MKLILKLFIQKVKEYISKNSVSLTSIMFSWTFEYFSPFSELLNSSCNIWILHLRDMSFIVSFSIFCPKFPNLKKVYFSPTHAHTHPFSVIYCYFPLFCRLVQKEKAWHHTRARNAALVNISAPNARENGWVETPGLTWDKNVSSATLMSILTNR